MIPLALVTRSEPIGLYPFYRDGRKGFVSVVKRLVIGLFCGFGILTFFDHEIL
jgi:hypothetical protein